MDIDEEALPTAAEDVKATTSQPSSRSALENLPTELLQQTWVETYSLDSAYTSPTIAEKLNRMIVRDEFVQRASSLFEDLWDLQFPDDYPGLWRVLLNPNHRFLLRLLRSEFMTNQVLEKVLPNGKRHGGQLNRRWKQHTRESMQIHLLWLTSGCGFEISHISDVYGEGAQLVLGAIFALGRDLVQRFRQLIWLEENHEFKWP